MLNPEVCANCCRKQIYQISKLLGVGYEDIEKEFNQKLEDGVFNTAPECAEFIFEKFRNINHIEDPYKETKDLQNQKALEILPNIIKDINNDNILDMLNLAISGNMLDNGVFENIDVKEHVMKVVHKDFFKLQIDEFKKDLNSASKIMYIADNAGEIVFDLKLIDYLIENLGKEVFLVLRSRPILNDITINDIKELKINNKIKLIDSGSKTPGFIYNKANKQAKDLFYSADLVISKGQGNFEAMYDMKNKPKNLYFLFIAKCKIVSDYLHAPENAKFLVKDI